MSSDRKQVGKKKKGEVLNIHPHEHKNDFKTYVNLCRERGNKPRFAELMHDWNEFFNGEISAAELEKRNPGFMKYVNETRRSAENTPVLSPVFDLDAAKASWEQFVKDGGYYGNWYKVDEKGLDEAIATVANDISMGRLANEVDYGRQDLPVDIAETLWKDRRKNRSHGRRFSDVAMIDKVKAMPPKDQVKAWAIIGRNPLEKSLADIPLKQIYDGFSMGIQIEDQEAGISEAYRLAEECQAKFKQHVETIGAKLGCPVCKMEVFINEDGEEKTRPIIEGKGILTRSKLKG